MTSKLRICAAFAGVATLVWVLLIGNFIVIKKIIALIVCLPLAFVVYWMLYKLICKYNDSLKKHSRLLCFIGLAVMFVLLLACGFMNKQKTVDAVLPALPDFVNTMVSAQHLAEYDILINADYFAIFPNNIPLLLFYTGIGKLLVLFTGSAELIYEVAIILNAIFITLAVWLCMRTAAFFGGIKASAICFVICFFFSPLYLVMPVAYTDVISFVLMAATLYFFVRFTGQKKLLYLALSGVACAVGMAFKPTVGIFAIAAVIILLLGKRSALKRIGVFLLMLTISLTCINLCVDRIGLISPEQSERYEYPIQYWLMMSLAGNGGFDADSANMMLYTEGYEQKKEVATAEFWRRVEEKGFTGMAYHMLITKVTTMWDSGTLGMYWRIFEPQSENLINTLLTNQTTFLAVNAVSQGFYVAIILLAISSGIKHRKSKPFQVMLLTIFGAFLFFMFWEVEARYLLQFMPIFIVLASIGIRPAYIAVTDIKKE